MLPEEHVTFVESGVSVLVGTRDAGMRPFGLRAMGAKVRADRKTLTVFIPDQTGERTLADLRDNGRTALTFTRPIDHRSMQLKGKAIAIRAATEDERPFLESYVEGWARHLEVVGLPRAIGSRLTYWPATAVDVIVEASYHQTPGPSAGKCLTARP
jgi:hypothetical protein